MECRMKLKLDGKESRHRRMLISIETQQRWAMERRWVEMQHRQGGTELKHKQLASRSDI